MLAALTLALLASAPPAAEFPGVQPRLAAAGRRVGLVFGEDRSIFFAGSRDGGRTFSAPVRVPSQGRLALGRHRGPRVALTGDQADAQAGGRKPGKGNPGRKSVHPFAHIRIFDQGRSVVSLDAGVDHE